MTNREIAAVLLKRSPIVCTPKGKPYPLRRPPRPPRNRLRLARPSPRPRPAGKPLRRPRLGKSLTAKISALASKDALQFYEELCDELPPEERALLKLKVPGLGPTIAARIHRDLGPTDAASLRRAAATGKLQRVWGIGP